MASYAPAELTPAREGASRSVLSRIAESRNALGLGFMLPAGVLLLSF
jgi:hypothetical protein